MSDTNLSDPPVDETPIAGEPPSPDPPPPAESPPEPASPPRMVPVDVLVREVTPLRAKIRETDAALDETRRQLNDARQLLERFQRQPGTDPNAAPAPAQRSTEQVYSQQDIDRRATELNFQRDAQAVKDAGAKSYGDRWDGYVNILASLGLDTMEFVSSIMDVAGRDKTHEVVHEIVQDPVAAAALARLSPVRRIAELTRMAERMTNKSAAPATSASAAPPAKTVSKAPPPAPRVESNAGQMTDWRSDKASDDEFSKGWNERYLRRGDAIRR